MRYVAFASRERRERRYWYRVDGIICASVRLLKMSRVRYPVFKPRRHAGASGRSASSNALAGGMAMNVTQVAPVWIRWRYAECGERSGALLMRQAVSIAENAITRGGLLLIVTAREPQERRY